MNLSPVHALFEPLLQKSPKLHLAETPRKRREETGNHSQYYEQSLILEGTVFIHRIVSKEGRTAKTAVSMTFAGPAVPGTTLALDDLVVRGDEVVFPALRADTARTFETAFRAFLAIAALFEALLG